jgi:uncharacterized membrane protein YoaK (UPF0700 family)
MNEMLIEYIKPELIVLIPVLYLVGIGIKKSQIADKHIPLLLGLISIVLCFLFVFATSIMSGWKEAIMAVFVSITQGILCAGASVYFHQFVKQSKKDE